MSFKLTEKDKLQIQKMNIDEKNLEMQIQQFEKGVSFADIVAPAVPLDGISIFEDDHIKDLCAFYDNAVSQNISLLKFVPASGAASRMFKDLFALRDKCIKAGAETPVADVSEFLSHLSDYAFYPDLVSLMSKDGLDIKKCIKENDFVTISNYILGEDGLNYAHTPKALIKFHNYGDVSRTAIEEHLSEGALYCKNEKGEVFLHFTISPEHEERVLKLLKEVKPSFEKHYGVKYSISHSFQKPATDTIAVDMNNMPFRNEDGSLLFRPGGHGALIENLNDCSSELIFIKNIDNIVPDRLKDTTVTCKKLIGGVLLSLKEQTHKYLDLLEDGNVNDSLLTEIFSFAQDKLNIRMKKNIEDKNILQKNLFEKLNRPLRVCGMVKNEGEPGGGPFWVKDSVSGDISLQIVEASQINMQLEQQARFVGEATHFNPVDLVCWVYDYKGQKFNLIDYVDKDSGFISQKSKDGQSLKALELPGLWNGAMAYWNTIFVDVPLITFNPVKTVEDLLRKEHIAIIK